MIPLLPEMSTLTLPPATPGTLPLAPAAEGGGLDFAGLLGAALPLPPVNGAAVVAITPGSVTPEDAAPPAGEVPALAAVTVAPLLPALLATGRNLPLPGAELPEPVATAQTSALAQDTAAEIVPAQIVLRRNVFETDDPAPTDVGAPSAPTVPVPVEFTAEPIAELPPSPPEEPEDAPAASDTPARDPEQPDAVLAIAIAPLVQLTPQTVASPPAAPEIVVAASPKRTLAPRLALALPAQADDAPPATEPAVPPMRPATAVASAKPEPASLSPLPAISATAPASAATPGDVAMAAADPASSPAVATPAAPAPIPTALAALAPASTPAPERTELRTEVPAPQQQSTIDQVGDLREALRSARPAMTLQHAEFGAVSVRLEATPTEGWRAVLASRDPGFVPAIQTALAERAVMAAAASSDSGGFMHHSGTGEHRSGSTPNGGQGASQPYLGQSASRDGEAAPDHRRPSTAAALAARAEAEEAGSGSPGEASGGLFA